MCASPLLRKMYERHVAFWGLDMMLMRALMYAVASYLTYFYAPVNEPLFMCLENLEDFLTRLARTELTSPSEKKWSPCQMRSILRACVLVLIMRIYIVRSSRPKGRRSDIVHRVITSNVEHVTLSTTILYLSGKSGIHDAFQDMASRMKDAQRQVSMPSQLIEEAEQVVLRCASEIDKDRFPCLFCSRLTSSQRSGGGHFCRNRLCSDDCRDKVLSQKPCTPTLCMQTRTGLHDRLLGTIV